MVVRYDDCPHCGFWDLAPRQILVGRPAQGTTSAREYWEILTLKCQNCGWLGEQPLRKHCAV
ncbi:hypothetical protein [Vampirovibrio chlorellavorus]|uniref:hypothetical protein n=1 Tax=Vampirovibrio chlorellavorus TaxID=758823 RepID=UPI0026EAAB48|nr:hypothetical protein [Vampirovibrio chlorellavorus]